uniref:Feruloyl esterase n=2 Tax=Corethron hystrix TaxID=216773 RepID=A0A7S1BN80_9STRA|mmetsp:Transcript_33599/g.77508  ORF Transcript_33599/g.77508 Transcript_33599/m.77508 type:complete len:225 (+) Transcript_33599:736-1410(+)
MIADFLARSDGLRGSLCFDPAATFALGDSNGGMFAWSLAQDSRTAPLLAGIAPVIAAPHCDHDRPQAKGTQVPVLSQTGKWDETVSPSELPWPGNPGDKCVTNRDGDMYRYLASHWITTTWAQGVEGCAVDRLTFPTKKYKFKGLSKESTLKCRTWCKGWKAHSVDCAFDGGHDSPEFTMQAALIFFDRHLPKKKRFDCRKIKKKQHCKKTSCAWKKKKCVSGS